MYSSLVSRAARRALAVLLAAATLIACSGDPNPGDAGDAASDAAAAPGDAAAPDSAVDAPRTGAPVPACLRALIGDCTPMGECTSPTPTAPFGSRCCANGVRVSLAAGPTGYRGEYTRAGAACFTLDLAATGGTLTRPDGSVGARLERVDTGVYAVECDGQVIRSDSDDPEWQRINPIQVPGCTRTGACP